ncbi:MAG: cation diffusion facilitator family transporter [[Pasteurella] mairii]|uniref:Cadmium, cobalt and zinc/H(+)-K(+) antiporter n=1 Tax=[Pasteurella] mairii TaxID=757 RepID=A0A379B3L4_9PAST|nr:cation diffusion facilitator family transporter [[Pasteurella] mairii]SUB33187.1 cadmium, cobalt and zinc/H(+)-K(+) antiporter [[Pasteurella] mairii]
MSNHNHHAHADHHHIPQDKTVLKTSFMLIASFMIIEFLGGYFFNSLALTADAGHMANDSLSLGLALLALHVADKSPRLEKYLTLINGASLILISVFIIYEAIQRLYHPQPMLSLPMLSIALFGLIINLIVAKLMLTADHHNLNIKAAYFHVLSDLFGSIIAIISGLAAYFLDWYWVDPVASLLLSLLILRSGWQITYTIIQRLKNFHIAYKNITE